MASKIINIAVTVRNVSRLSSLRRGDILAVAGHERGFDSYRKGIFLGHDVGVVDFGSDNGDMGSNTDSLPSKVDLLNYARLGQRRLVQITYQDPPACISTPEEAANKAEALCESSKIETHNACECYVKDGVPNKFDIEEQLLKQTHESLADPIKLMKYYINYWTGHEFKDDPETVECVYNRFENQIHIKKTIIKS